MTINFLTVLLLKLSVLFNPFNTLKLLHFLVSSFLSMHALAFIAVHLPRGTSPDQLCSWLLLLLWSISSMLRTRWPSFRQHTQLHLRSDPAPSDCSSGCLVVVSRRALRSGFCSPLAIFLYFFSYLSYPVVHYPIVPSVNYGRLIVGSLWNSIMRFNG